MGSVSMGAVIILSGGTDSVTLLYRSLHKYKPLHAFSFNYGSKHNARELEFARWHCTNLNIQHQTISLVLPFK